MGSVIKKEFIYQILFFVCVAIPYLNNYELTFGVWGVAAAITIQKKYSLTILHYLLCFTGILAIAFLSSFSEHVGVYNFIRDFTYLLKPILGLIIGYQLCKSHLKNPLLLIVNTGIIIAVLHLLLVLNAVFIIHVNTMPLLREFAGYFSDFEVYAIVFLIFRNKLEIPISKRKFQTGLLVLAVSIFFYLARTNFIQLVILILALTGYFVMNTRSVIILSALTVFILGGYAIIYSLNPSEKATGFEAFLYKIKNAPIEPFKSKVNADDWQDFNYNYRSYETILTLRQVPSKGPGAVAFGEGLGSSIDLKKKVWLQSSFMRYIPFLHNGFMTIFLKSGLAGILVLLYSIYIMFKNPKSDIPLVTNINFILVGTGIFLIASYWVFMGLYFTVDTKSLIIGFLIRYRENIIRLKRAPLYE